MLFTTPTQFAVLLLMLVIGWLFGFASHPGGRKWKAAYRDERAARTKDVAERDARLRDLEASNAALIAERDRAAVAPVAVRSARPDVAAPRADRAPEKRGWFEWSRGDDLTRLRGVDHDLAQRLSAEGVDSFAELADLSDQDEIALERRIDLPAGFIRREQLREQARLLAAGRADEHGKAFD